MTRSSTAPKVSPHLAGTPVFGHQVTTDGVRPDNMMPEQFFTSGPESHASWTGERLLLLAVLQEAVHTYLRYCHSRTRRGQRLFAEVQAWFSSNERHYLYSFVSTCEHLDMDPEYLRRGIVQRAASTTKNSQPAHALPRRASATSRQPPFARAA